ncbi:MAG: hypothetical protein RL701_2135 [Pseudomonadota bacterium]
MRELLRQAAERAFEGNLAVVAEHAAVCGFAGLTHRARTNAGANFAAEGFAIAEGARAFVHDGLAFGVSRAAIAISLAVAAAHRLVVARATFRRSFADACCVGDDAAATLAARRLFVVAELVGLALQRGDPAAGTAMRCGGNRYAAFHLFAAAADRPAVFAGSACRDRCAIAIHGVSAGLFAFVGVAQLAAFH